MPFGSNVNFNSAILLINKTIKDNSPTILTTAGVVGTVTTAYLSGRASIRASKIIRQSREAEEWQTQQEVVFKSKPDKIKHDVKLVWRLYVPTVISGTLTVSSIVASNKLSSKRSAAIAAAYTITEQAFSDYRDMVVEQLGPRKESNIRDAVAENRVKNNPPTESQVIISEPGNVLCYEVYTGRYFHSNMEKLRRAMNQINYEINSERYVTLSTLYDLLDLKHTASSDRFGWDSDRLLDFQFSPVLSEQGIPCIAFDYNYIKML